MTTYPREVLRRVRSVLVIDDQRTFADLLASAVDAQPDLHALDVAYDLTTGLELLDRHEPDVVILDVHFDGDTRDGVDVAFEVRLRHPRTRVVLLSGLADASILGRAAAAGASAVMAKNGSLEEVLRAVRAEGGGLTVDPLVLQAPPLARADPRAPALTPREADVLRMLALGMDARVISEHLDIRLNTCRSYIKALLWKFDAHSQLECVAIARRMGMFGQQTEPGGSDGSLAAERNDRGAGLAPGTAVP